MSDNRIAQLRGKGYGSRRTRRMPDTYNAEAVSAVPARGGKSVVNPEQFHFLGETEHLRPTGDPKTSRRLQDLKYMANAEHLMFGTTRAQLGKERYRG